YKNTRQDLEWLKNEFGQALDQYHCQGGHLLGICGGYQMLGQKVADPHGLEGQPGDTTGLGLLPVETILKAPKTTTLSDFSWGGARGQGYEIHMGATHLTQPSQGRSLVDITTRNQTPCRETDGCMAGDGRVMGTYVHGFFDTVAVTRKWLDAIGLAEVDVPGPDLLAQKEKDYDLLKEHVEAHIDLSAYY
ncbi:MAG: cobyric acid synthase, partial [Desulfobacterales bacterium]|nr:cobyric acid synthase [Desulfobacterales bacterium]